MPSSPSATADRPLDLDHLARMTLGEDGLAREVLEMFLAQTGRLLAAFDDEPAAAGSLAHTLKGSARSVGAFRVAERAAAVESAAGQGHDPRPAIAQLHAAVDEARAAIETVLRRF